jgi:beta-glucosidase
VVQCYVAPTVTRLVRPPKELAAFAKVWLDPGESTTVELVLDDRSVAYWECGQPDRDEISRRAAAVPMTGGRGPAADPGWRIDAGTYELHIGRSSADIAHVVTVDVVSTTPGR